MKRIAILGSTGSIGQQTLEVISAYKNNFCVTTLAAKGNNLELFAWQLKKWKPAVAVVQDENKFNELKKLVGKTSTKILCGDDAILSLCGRKDIDLVLVAIVGIAGLKPTLHALKNKKDVATANKEPLVSAGELIMKEAKKSGVHFIPVDSEHSALFQCFTGEKARDVKTLILTSSGGPFRTATYAQMKKATVRDALAHPTWKMGRKITIDSATLMNKGLEVIEAHFLFGLEYGRINVVIHPQSIVHGMLELNDGTVKMAASPPDMKLPISFALFYPHRAPSAFQELSFKNLCLTFEMPDEKKFPCLKFARQAGIKGGTYPAVLNGANEKAVELFLDGKITFMKIPELVYGALSGCVSTSKAELSDILNADARAREHVLRKVKK